MTPKYVTQNCYILLFIQAKMLLNAKMKELILIGIVYAALYCTTLLYMILTSFFVSLCIKRNTTIWINRILVSEPCEKTYCSWGATCVVSENGKPLCQCPTDCPSTSEPVCGSDNMTYTNYCHLRKTSCLERKTTRVKNQGACGEYHSRI